MFVSMVKVRIVVILSSGAKISNIHCRYIPLHRIFANSYKLLRLITPFLFLFVFQSPPYDSHIDSSNHLYGDTCPTSLGPSVSDCFSLPSFSFCPFQFSTTHSVLLIKSSSRGGSHQSPHFSLRTYFFRVCAFALRLAKKKVEISADFVASWTGILRPWKSAQASEVQVPHRIHDSNYMVKLRKQKRI